MSILRSMMPIINELDYDSPEAKNRSKILAIKQIYIIDKARCNFRYHS